MADVLADLLSDQVDFSEDLTRLLDAPVEFDGDFELDGATFLEFTERFALFSGDFDVDGPFFGTEHEVSLTADSFELSEFMLGERTYWISLPSTTALFTDDHFFHNDPFIFFITQTDNFEFDGASFLPGMSYGITQADAFEFSETWDRLRWAMTTFSDQIAFAEVFELAGSFGAEFFDVFAFADYTNPERPYAVGWTLNLETNAPSRYDWPLYNSFALLDGVAYGASEDGIFQLEGEDDFGDNVRWFLLTGKEVFDSPMAKNVSRGYLIAKFDGAVYLKTVVAGTDTARTYRLVSTNDELLQRRLPLGKGPRAVRWQFALQDTNDGGDIEADAIAVYPVVLTRRFP
jgi:hypothetical protein